MSWISDFRKFAVSGNLLQVAIAFVMGVAFNGVITSFVEGLVSPIIGMITGRDLTAMKYVYRPEIKNAAGEITQSAIVFQYGLFFMALINFFTIALVCYWVIRAVMKKDPNAAPEPTTTEVLLTEIRDAVQK